LAERFISPALLVLYWRVIANASVPLMVKKWVSLTKCPNP